MKNKIQDEINLKSLIVCKSSVLLIQLFICQLFPKIVTDLLNGVCIAYRHILLMIADVDIKQHTELTSQLIFFLNHLCKIYWINSVLFHHYHTNIQPLGHILNILPRSEVGFAMGNWPKICPALIQVLRKVDLRATRMIYLTVSRSKS